MTRLFDELIVPASSHLHQERPFVIIVDALDEGFDHDLIMILAKRVPNLPKNLRFVITTRPEHRIMSKLQLLHHISTYSGSLTGPEATVDIHRYVCHEMASCAELSQVPSTIQDDLVRRSEGVFLWAYVVLTHVKQALSPVNELERLLSSSSRFWAANEHGRQRLDTLYSAVLSSLPWGDADFLHAFESVLGAMVVAREPTSIETLSTLLSLDVPTITAVLSRIRPLIDGFDASRPDCIARLLHLSICEYLTERASFVYRIDEGLQHYRVGLGCLNVIDRDLIPERVRILGYTAQYFQYDEETESYADWYIPGLSAGDIPTPLQYACRHLQDHLANVGVGLERTAHRDLLRKILSSRSMFLLELSTAMGGVIELWASKEWWFNVCSCAYGGALTAFG